MPGAAQINESLRGFDRLYGLEMISCSREESRAQVALRDELRQPGGLLHGGVIASIAESLASLTTWMAVREAGRVAMGLSNNTSFLRPLTDGTAHAHATRLHGGRTTWVWDVRVSDDEGCLCAISRVTVAVR